MLPEEELKYAVSQCNKNRKELGKSRLFKGASSYKKSREKYIRSFQNLFDCANVKESLEPILKRLAQCKTKKDLMVWGKALSHLYFFAQISKEEN